MTSTTVQKRLAVDARRPHYQPVPGTVAFVGYGNNLVEPDGFHFNPLRRVADNFFVKFSYLFRM